MKDRLKIKLAFFPSIFGRIKKVIRRIVLLRSVEEESFCVVLPELKSHDFSAKQLYRYWWVAENIQYYKLPLVKYRLDISRSKSRFLGDSPSFAILPLHYSFDDYFANVIKSPERALIRKAIKNGITCKAINYDDFLDEVQWINLSKEERGGRPMSDDYRNLHLRDSIVKPYNSNIYTYGAFSSEGHLVAYYMFEKVTNFLHVVKGIGHSDYLKYGIMNYLFAYSISELSSDDNISSSIIYGRMNIDNPDGLSKFKNNVGCKSTYVRVLGTSKQFKALEYFNSAYKLHGDTSMNYILDYLEVPDSSRMIYSNQTIL